jgi:DNA repair photolyase
VRLDIASYLCTIDGMRWAHLTEDAAPSGAPLPLALPNAVVRTFDTPGFAGMTFYEVRAKSIINRVPSSSYVPFEWTLNPYRGCSHACAYCLSGDTPILMADGRAKPLADLRTGDRVYGTVREGNYRRYVAAEVLAHWSTVKPAYRVTVEDGTQLIASGDHRFLTNRGWKYVTGRMSGSGRRPYLTTGNELMGVGRFAAPPKDSPEYRRGYLCGMIRGDGHLGAYSYDRPGRTNGDVYRFRLALIDGEALERSQRYLAGFGISTDRFQFSAATATRNPIHAIRTSKQASVEQIRALIAWPEYMDDTWSKGFLAGIFDAEGSNAETIRISNSDQEILDRVAMALERFGFVHVVEGLGRSNGVRDVRLIGGLRERLRFVHLADPAISRKRTIDGTAIKSDAKLGVVSIEPLGFNIPMYDITTSTGDFIADGVVSHNCFARKTHTYLDLDAGEDFDRRVVVKVNAGELLRRELAAPRWGGDPIAMGTNVDCYQRAEGRYRLMREILSGLRDFANPFSILTKGTLLLRDLDLLRQAAEVTDVRLAVSVGFVDEALWRSVEPGTPSPRRRLDMVRQLSDAGFPVAVLMAPILPVLTDGDASIDATVAAIAAAGAASLTPLVLHLRPGAREWYGQWLAREHPELVPRYRELYARGSYAPKHYQQGVAARVRIAARRHGLDRPSRPSSPDSDASHRQPSRAPVAEQPTLW